MLNRRTRIKHTQQRVGYKEELYISKSKKAKRAQK
jgi:hypothetical protein